MGIVKMGEFSGPLLLSIAIAGEGPQSCAPPDPPLCK
jgi:hypothetical protein